MLYIVRTSQSDQEGHLVAILEFLDEIYMRKIEPTLCNLARIYDRTTNLTRSISVCTSVIRKCSSSDVDGSERRS